MPQLEFTGAQVLLAIRDEKARDFKSLCSYFGIEGAGLKSLQYSLRRKLQSLMDAGIIYFDDLEHGRITLTQAWEQIQMALEISLSQVARSPIHNLEHSFFGRASGDNQLDIFVLMPFAPELKPIYEDHILRVASKLGLEARRADDFFSVTPVMRDIWNALNAARVVVAECTGRNANVFYEIGLAHVIGVPVVLITQSADDVPSDLRHFRYIQYTYTPRGVKQLEASLSATLKEILF